MGKGKKQHTASSPEGTAGTDNWVSPFRDLKITVPPPAPPLAPPPPPAPTPEELRKQKLSRADLELLKAFGGEEATSPVKSGAKSASGTPPAPKGPALTLAVERKGRGGKTVTIVRGLQGLDTAALMAVGAEIKTALGIGARFADAVLELQGDQRQRAAAWFENRNFSCRILP